MLPDGSVIVATQQPGVRLQTVSSTCANNLKNVNIRASIDVAREKVAQLMKQQDSNALDSLATALAALEQNGISGCDSAVGSLVNETTGSLKSWSDAKSQYIDAMRAHNQAKKKLKTLTDSLASAKADIESTNQTLATAKNNSDIVEYRCIDSISKNVPALETALSNMSALAKILS
jgi:chromosome segregation ATPase